MSDPVQRNLYQHAARPEWGGAVIVWERDGKRAYQFEDGQLRIFTAGHYHLLEPVDASPDRVRTLRALLGMPAEREPAPSAAPLLLDLPSFDEQVAYFLAAYPGGFAGPRWRGDHRGGRARSRKRHRDRAVALAREQLTASHLATCLEGGRDGDGLETLAAVLGQTDLVAWTHVHQLGELPPNRARAVLVGLVELLYGRSSIEVRMVQWVHALSRGTGRKPGWALATAPLALLFPDRHVCVHRGSFAAQATAMELRPRLAAHPSGVEYAPLLALAERVRAHLAESSCPPIDLLDVHDFMLFTLGAAALQRMARGRRAR